jgi:beta-xylosidase
MRSWIALLTAMCTPILVQSAETEAWSADLGDGRYRNPVLHADYSDPDAIRVGGDYWLTSSSFNHVPALPILHSRDLVNWELVGHALPRLVPEDVFATPQPGKGVWAPALRHHRGRFWLYYPDPDFGLYLLTAADARGPWSAPQLVKAGKGLIDPCPFWDDDGTLYLIHGWAKSRAGFANVLTLLRLTPDGTAVAEDLGVIIDGARFANCTTLEGPKLYRKDGWYYVFAPAGGVATGWQYVFRSRELRGPYTEKIVLAQGRSAINGPHQGALVDTPAGEWWFLHFQDKDAYGRIIHLQPVQWKDGWPVIGADADGEGTGEPVLAHAKPVLPAGPRTAPVCSDEFGSAALGLQWQWQANPQPAWLSLTARSGWLRLFAQPVRDGNLYHAGHLLLQKFPAETFVATAKLDLSAARTADAGLVVFGYDYAWIGCRAGRVVRTTVGAANETPRITEIAGPELRGGALFVRVRVGAGAVCRFEFSTDGERFTPLGQTFTASRGRWVGAKVGLFASGAAGEFVDCDWIRLSP